MITRKTLIDALIRCEEMWEADGESRLAGVLRGGFIGYNKFTKPQLVQQAKDFDIWEDLCQKDQQATSRRS